MPDPQDTLKSTETEKSDSNEKNRSNLDALRPSLPKSTKPVDPSTQILKNKYNLHKSSEVENAANRHQERTGEKVEQNPLSRIQNYLNRFQEIDKRTNPEDREHGIDAIKRILYRKHVIKPDEIPEAYFENQRRVAREQGHGDIEITAEMKKQLTEVIIADQQSSLDKWIDYLASPDAPYSDSLKYFTLRNVLNMGEYDKEKKAYPQRSKGTTKPFPDLNREALAYVLDRVEKKYNGQSIDSSGLNEQETKKFENLIQGENFSKLYAWAIEKVMPADEKGLANINGKWVKYDKGSDHMSLVALLQGHGTGWCTAGQSTAQSQLKSGDFYIFYSNDRDEKPTIPRVAIRMQGNSIAEVRGIAPDQNLDQYVAPIVEKKLEEFPDGKEYQKKLSDMKRLTEIDKKSQSQVPLNASDLAFLYEIDKLIQGFGYDRDPRIEELKSQRNSDKDMPIMFNCEPSQIASNSLQIKPDTKAYVGSLEPGIFNKLTSLNVDYIYTSFPEGKIERKSIEIGGETKEQIKQALAQAKVKVSTDAEDMIKNPDFTTLPTAKTLEIVRLKVEDLGLEFATTSQVYRKAQELGLDLCPPEVGPRYRLQYLDQPLGEVIHLGMKEITDAYRYPGVFFLVRYDNVLNLQRKMATSNKHWGARENFIFSLQKTEN